MGAMALAGCRSPGVESEGRSEAAKDETDDESDEEKSGESSKFDMSSMGPMAQMFAVGLDQPGPYDEPRQSDDFDAAAESWRVLELRGSLSELKTFSLFSGTATTSLRDLRERLHDLEDEALVRGLVVRFSGMSFDMASAQSLREALVAFKGEGAREVVCHSESLGNADYYVATACDRIGLAPLGSVNIPGAASIPIHVKGLMDRLGLRADFLHVGDYKGAAEPLTLDEPSPEMLETLGAIVEQSYLTLREGIESRGLSEEDAKAAIDRGMFVAQEAKEAGLVDDIATYESFLGQTTQGGWKVLEDDKKGAGPLGGLLSLQRFLGMLPSSRPTEDHVALVYAVGNIIDGKGNGVVGAREEIASRTLVSALRTLSADSSVKAVVMRVDSGGGSALASEQIWAAASELAGKKPFLVSMGSVAASGGYYISSPAQKIFARENTLTGSIGVVGGKIVVGDALERLGVRTFEVGRGKRATMWSPMQAWSEDERAAVRAMMEHTYEVFLSRVSEGRDLTRDEAHAIAQGRVWTGVAAKEHGLVDAIGGLDDALAEARSLAGLDEDAPLEVYPPEPTLKDLMSSMDLGMVSASNDVGTLLRSGWMELVGPTVHASLDAHHADAIFAVVRAVLDLRHARVWAWSPVQPAR